METCRLCRIMHYGRQPAFHLLAEMTTGRLVCTIALFPDSISAAVRCETAPAEFVLTATSHMIAATIAFDAMRTLWATTVLGRFQQLEKRLMAALGICVVLLASSALMPRTAVGETRLRAAFVATHDRILIAAAVKLTGSAAFTRAPTEFWIFHESLAKKATVIKTKRVWISVLLDMNVVQFRIALGRCADTADIVVVLLDNYFLNVALEASFANGAIARTL